MHFKTAVLQEILSVCKRCKGEHKGKGRQELAHIVNERIALVHHCNGSPV